MAAKITKRERKSQKALERMLLGKPEHQQGMRPQGLSWDDLDDEFQDDANYHRYREDSAHRGGNKKKGGRVKWER